MPNTDPNELKHLDHDGPKVLKLVEEVSRRPGVSKIDYLKKILLHGSKEAKILKSADRISNITDLHLDIMIQEKMADYLEQTMTYIYPMAEKVNHYMAIEIMDLVERRRMYLTTWNVG